MYARCASNFNSVRLNNFVIITEFAIDCYMCLVPTQIFITVSMLVFPSCIYRYTVCISIKFVWLKRRLEFKRGYKNIAECLNTGT